MATNFSSEAKRLLSEALTLFKTGQYFECHELIETQLWLNEVEAQQKRFYQRLIQLAVARHHHSHHNIRGYDLQLQKALHGIEQHTPTQRQWFQRFRVDQQQL
jgi:predicted metal-dependent hydrolase